MFFGSIYYVGRVHNLSVFGEYMCRGGGLQSTSFTIQTEKIASR